MGIYNNERVLDIFVSSTKKDLSKQRRSAIDLIGKLGHRPLAMERFPSGNENSKQFIRKCIRDADLFVFILGKTIGSPTEPGKKKKTAFVQWEYQTAIDLGKKIVAFVPDDKECNTSELPEEVKNYRQMVMNSGKFCGFFRFDKLDKFKEDLRDAIQNESRLFDRDQDGGWIRSETLEEYVLKNDINLSLINSPTLSNAIDSICGFSNLTPNLDKDIDEKRSIGRFFWRMLSTALEAQNGISKLYFDGGSTTYWICKEFNEYCGSTRSYFHNDAHKKISISTNGILNFLELSLGIKGATRPYKSLKLYPAPPINNVFGKSFGDIVNITQKTAYSYHHFGWKLSSETKRRILAVAKEFESWQTDQEKQSLTVLSPAGVDLSKDSEGPWVKSHRTMLQQQAIFRSRVPLLLAIDGRKWDSQPSVQEGFRVLFDGISWSDVLISNPLAFAASTFSQEKSKIMGEYFKSFGMKTLYDTAQNNRENRKLYRLLAFNSKFSPLLGL